jgi:hypothetical protein
MEAPRTLTSACPTTMRPNPEAGLRASDMGGSVADI